MTMTMDLDIVMVIFYQHFLWWFQKHITLGVFGNWKKPSSQARVTFKPPTLEHLIFSQPSPPCPLSIKFLGIFFVRLLDMIQSRTTGGTTSGSPRPPRSSTAWPWWRDSTSGSWSMKYEHNGSIDLCFASVKTASTFYRGEVGDTQAWVQPWMIDHKN